MNQIHYLKTAARGKAVLPPTVGSAPAERGGGGAFLPATCSRKPAPFPEPLGTPKAAWRSASRRPPQR